MNDRKDGVARLSEEARAALWAIRSTEPGEHLFIPARERRAFFRHLVEGGLANSEGYRLGGEAFTITEAGRAALTPGDDDES